MILDRSNTALVVDSTADLSPELAQDPNLTIVPLTVLFGDQAYLDWLELRPEEFEAYLEHFRTNNTFVFLPITLDYLYKGGRIGRASHLVGTLLNIKPVLMIDDGVADVYKKVRGTRQALETMRDCLLDRTQPGSDVFANVSHGLNVPLAEQLRGLVMAVSDRRVHLRPGSIVGSVIGTYAGPSAVGLGFIQE